MSSNSLLVDSVQAVSDLKGPMENRALQSNLVMFQNIEFEEKNDIKQEPLDNQILPSKRIKLEIIESMISSKNLLKRKIIMLLLNQI